MVLYEHQPTYGHYMFGGRHSSAYAAFNPAMYSTTANQYEFPGYPGGQVFPTDHLQSQHTNPYCYDYRSASADDHWSLAAAANCNSSMNSGSAGSQLPSPHYRNSPASSMGDTYGQISPVPSGFFSSSQAYFSGSQTSASLSGSNGGSGQGALSSGSGSAEKVTIKSEPASSPNAKAAKFDWINKSGFHSHNSGSAPVSGKTRTKDKYRVVYSDHQRVELEREFTRHKYIDVKRKAELARALLLSERQVKIWFQNRRAKDRKQGKKRVDPSPVASRPGTQLSAPAINSVHAFRSQALQMPLGFCHDRQFEHHKMDI